MCHIQGPQVAGGPVILLNIWFGFTQAAVTSPHQSHESHPVILGRAADRSWYILQRCRGYHRPLRVMMWGEGINDDDIKGRPAFCVAVSPPRLQAVTPPFSPAVALFSLTWCWETCWFEIDLDLDITGNPTETLKALHPFPAFYHYLN